MSKLAPFLAPHHKAHIGLIRFKTCGVVSVTRPDRIHVYTVSPRRAASFYAWLERLHADVAAGRTRPFWPSGEFLPGGRYSGYLLRPQGVANHG